MWAGFKGPYLFAGTALAFTLFFAQSISPGSGEKDKATAPSDKEAEESASEIGWPVFMKRFGVKAVILCSAIASMGLDFTGEAHFHEPSALPPHSLHTS